MENKYIPFLAEILEIKKHTDIEYTFRVAYDKDDVKPGQFFEISIPKYGEAPISVSGIREGSIDFTIRKVGKVTNEIFEKYLGEKLLMRGPYGNGFDIDLYKNKELVIVAGGTGVSPVRGVIEYFTDNPNEVIDFKLITGFKSKEFILFKDDIPKWRKNSDFILTVDQGEETDEYKVGLVTKYIPNLKLKDISTSVAIVVGPPAMMKFSALALLEAGFKPENIWISQERKMCCGIGKCGHCRINDVYVCVDGPVFNYVKGSTLID